MVLNARKIAFARHLIIGKKSAAEAYKLAGYKCTTDNALWSAASRLLGTVEIQQYINQLQEEIKKNTLIETQTVVDELIAIGCSNITDIIAFSNDSVTFKPSKELDKRVTKAIESIERFQTTRIDKEGNETTNTRMKLKLHSKNQALKILGDFAGVGSDINIAKAIYRKYGWNVYFDNDNQLKTEWIGITEKEKEVEKNKTQEA